MEGPDAVCDMVAIVGKIENADSLFWADGGVGRDTDTMPSPRETTRNGGPVQHRADMLDNLLMFAKCEPGLHLIAAVTLGGTIGDEHQPPRRNGVDPAARADASVVLSPGLT